MSPKKKKSGPRKPAAPEIKGPARDPLLDLKIALIILAAGLMVRLAIAWQPFNFQLKYGPLVDDAFYSLNVSRHIARGEGPTCDGINFTNGFQPLYVFLMVPVYWVWPNDPIKPVYAAMTLLALASAGAGWFLFRIARRRWGPGPAWFALGCYCFSPYFIIHGINGLETSLAALGWMAALDIYYGRIKPGGDRWRDRAILAAVLAALVFTRIDGGILAAAIALDYLLRRAPGGKPMRDRMIGISQVAALALLLYAPWVVWNMVYFGTPLPTSGSAVRLLSQMFGDEELIFKLPAFELGRPPLDFYLGNFLYIFDVRIYGQLFFPSDQIYLLMSKILKALRMPPLSFVLVSLALFTAGMVWARRVERSMDAIFIAVALMLGAYGFVIFGHWFFTRYLFPVELCLLLLSAAVLRDLMGRVSKTRAVYVLAGIALIYGVIFYRSARFNFLDNKMDKIENFYLAARSLDETIAPKTRIGVFQSGTIAYFSNHQVINLDGVVNERAGRALRENRLSQYLADNNITHVADYGWILNRLLFQPLSPAERNSFKLVSPRDSMISIYKKE
jgi:hypothetical protein